MHLVDVDVVGAKPPQGCVDLLQDACTAGIAEHPPTLPFESDLGRDQHARTQVTFSDGLADDLFRAPEPVGRSGVDDVDAVLDRRADRANRFDFVGSAPHPAADRPGADGDTRYIERGPGNAGVLHADFRLSIGTAMNCLLSLGAYGFSVLR